MPGSSRVAHDVSINPVRFSPLWSRFVALGIEKGVAGHRNHCPPQPNRYGDRVFQSLGRTKSGRHRPVSVEPGPNRPGHELESFIAALAPESECETTASGRRFGDAEVHQLRMPLGADEQIRRYAEERNTSPLALIQEWVMQRLQFEAEQDEMFQSHRHAIGNRY